MSPLPRDWFGSRKPKTSGSIVHAEHSGVAVGRDVRNSTVTVKKGLDEDETGRLVAEALSPFAEKMTALADQVAREKGIPAMPLRAVLAWISTEANRPNGEIAYRFI